MTFQRRRPIFAFALALFALVAGAKAQETRLRNRSLVVTVNSSDGTYTIAAAGAAAPFVRARVGAKVNGHWLFSSDYPRHEAADSTFQDELGGGKQVTVTNTGSPDRPDLTCVLRVYDEKPFADVLVTVHSGTSQTLTIEAIRVLDAVKTPVVNLGQPESAIRVLSDSFSEDRPEMAIHDLLHPPEWGHVGVGSQLIYNRETHQSLFIGALTAERWLTVLRLGLNSAGDGIGSYIVDSTGTSDIYNGAMLQKPRAEDIVEPSIPLEPGKDLSSERVMFQIGDDYHAELETYARAIRDLNHARAGGPNLIGWWSWTAFYGGITEGEVMTNAEWLSAHLLKLGYDWFHVDEGYEYARGEYTTENATQFPRGMRVVGQAVTRLGFKLALWTAPFEVSKRAWVYENHPDWLVKNSAGQPIQIGDVDRARDALYALDTTNPGAQDYLRETYRILTHEWGVRYFKLDFMDEDCVEGYRYQPNTTALEAERIGLEIIRKAVGDDVLLDKDGSPMLTPVGLVDEGRVSLDTGHSFGASKEAAPGIAARYYMHRNFFVNDPDAFTISRQILPDQSWHQSKAGLSLNEAQVSIALSAVSGGMFEIGDDLPTLAADPARLALVENAELLRIARLGRAAIPLDLMTYDHADLQPSVFFLREDRRVGVLTVFNWTETTRSHSFKISDLKFQIGDQVQAFDVFSHHAPVEIVEGGIALRNQPPHSVRMIKLVDNSIPSARPAVSTKVPASAATGEEVDLSAEVQSESVPALGFRWDFGDGTTAEGEHVRHTYTLPGTFTVRLRVDGLDGLADVKESAIKVSGPLKTRFTLDQNRRYVDPTGP
jgi:alpha-galactosidase